MVAMESNFQSEEVLDIHQMYKSAVLYLTKIPSSITVNLLEHLISKYGVVKRSIILRPKNEALVEMNTLEEAVSLHDLCQENPLNLNNNCVEVTYSKYTNLESLVNRNPVSPVLLVTICSEETKHLKMKELLVIVESYVKVSKMHLFVHRRVSQALVEFNNVNDAFFAKTKLEEFTYTTNNRVYRFEVQFSKITTISIIKSSSTSYDCTLVGKSSIKNKSNSEKYDDSDDHSSSSSSCYSNSPSSSSSCYSNSSPHRVESCNNNNTDSTKKNYKTKSSSINKNNSTMNSSSVPSSPQYDTNIYSDSTARYAFYPPSEDRFHDYYDSTVLHNNDSSRTNRQYSIYRSSTDPSLNYDIYNRQKTDFYTDLVDSSHYSNHSVYTETHSTSPYSSPHTLSGSRSAIHSSQVLLGTSSIVDIPSEYPTEMYQEMEYTTPQESCLYEYNKHHSYPLFDKKQDCCASTISSNSLNSTLSSSPHSFKPYRNNNYQQSLPPLNTTTTTNTTNTTNTTDTTAVSNTNSPLSSNTYPINTKYNSTSSYTYSNPSITSLPSSNRTFVVYGYPIENNLHYLYDYLLHFSDIFYNITALFRRQGYIHICGELKYSIHSFNNILRKYPYNDYIIHLEEL
ncbi:hypothetical protein WA158_008328 [Blastocystis sp. Blastoise]